MGGSLSLEVHNQGVISESVLPSLFAPFRGTKEPSQGDGLGLGVYITNEVVRSHGGTVDVSSSEAAGTTFTVRLPRHCAIRSAESDGEARSASD